MDACGGKRKNEMGKKEEGMESEKKVEANLFAKVAVICEPKIMVKSEDVLWR